MVNHVMPKTLEEAYRFLKDARYLPFAGGTDLMVQKRSWSETLPKTDIPFLFLSGIRELDDIHTDATSMTIGAMASLEKILSHPETSPLLKALIQDMASPGIRHQATLAGNIENASPAGDSLVGLVLLDATVVCGSLEGERAIRITDYITGVRKTLRRSDEIILRVIVPKMAMTGYMIRKVGTRKADAISKVSFGGFYRVEHQVIKAVRIAFGAVAPKVIRDKDIESSLIGLRPEAISAMMPSIREKYRALIRPIDDQRSTRTYRLNTALSLLEAFCRQISDVTEI
jgi:CO/xanthine dehydrogenase FAD-binding subunit